LADAGVQYEKLIQAGMGGEGFYKDYAYVLFALQDQANGLIRFFEDMVESGQGRGYAFYLRISKACTKAGF